MVLLLLILLTLTGNNSNAQESVSAVSQPTPVGGQVQGRGANKPIESTNRTTAKQQLEAKGISFNEELFLKYVSNGDTDIVKSFLDAGIRPSAKNQEGETALVVASKKGHRQIARMLIDAGADLEDLVDSYHDQAEKKEKKKDIWDKLSALSSIATVFSSILVAAIGWYFTQSYNQRQIAQNKIQNDRDAALKEQQNRLVEMETIEKMIPHLTKDEESKRVALVTIRNLARPELATQMAQLYPSDGSVLALQQFASSSNPEERKQAVNALSGIAISGVEQTKASALGALGSIFDNFKSAVVRIKCVSDSGQESRGSGLIVTNEGHILTAKYIVAPAVGNGDNYTYSVEMWDGSTKTAILQDVNSTDDLAILKIEGGNYRIINLASNIPPSNTRVVTIGAIMGGPIKPAVGTIRAVTEQFLEIEFDTPGGMAGIGGGPVLNAFGEVVGISYAFKPPLRQSIRIDIAKKYLQSKGVRI